MATEPAVTVNETRRIPSCREIGLQAGKKGDFQLARQMLQNAIAEMEGQDGKQAQMIELTINMADTYLNEGQYGPAKTWYTKALDRLILSQGANTVAVASLMGRCAEISVLQADMNEFQKCFDSLQRAYLLTAETEMSGLLNSLIDLSWALCIKGEIAAVQAVNDLINQIKQLEKETAMSASVA